MPPQALGVVPFQNEAGNIAASQQSSVRAPTAQFFVTMMPFLLVVSVKPAVWLVNDPLREPLLTELAESWNGKLLSETQVS